jgi:hypothetical protein
MIRIGQAIFTILTAAITMIAPVSGKSLNPDHWVVGEYTQNAPCKGDGSDPAELKARISSDQIESKARTCKFLDTQSEANRLKAHALCQFPLGPLIGDFTFTRKANGTIDFVDRDGTYSAVLHRCLRQ